jgi:NADPH2:quinone reductase
MRALRFAAVGSLEHLSLGEVPEPTAARGSVVVEVRAAGINPSDFKNVLGEFPYTTVPRTPGRDYAGVVVEGPNELLGKEVFGSGREFGFTEDGSHAERIVVPLDAVVAKPRAISFAQAAALGVPYVTAWEALERTLLGPAETLLVIGAAGAVGRAATTLGRLRGGRVAGAVRRKEQAAIVHADGARPIELPGDGDVRAACRTFAPDGVDVVLDCTGSWFGASADALAAGGRLAYIAAPPEERVTFDALRFYRRGATVIGINSLLHDSRAMAKMLAPVARAMDGGQLAPPPEPKPVPLRDGVAAYRALQDGSTVKVVLVP